MIIGFVAGVGIALASNAMDWDLPSLFELIPEPLTDWSAVVAGLLAIIYILSGVVAALATIVPDRLHKALEVEPEDIEDQPDLYRWQAVSAIGLGLAIGVLVLAQPLDLIAPIPTFVMFVLFAGLGTWGYARSWQEMDELLKAVSAEAITLGYYLIVIFGGGWAVLGHLGLAAGPEFLDWISILWSMIIVSSIWTMSKRGMLDE